MSVSPANLAGQRQQHRRLCILLQNAIIGTRDVTSAPERVERIAAVIERSEWLSVEKAH